MRAGLVLAHEPTVTTTSAARMAASLRSTCSAIGASHGCGACAPERSGYEPQMPLQMSGTTGVQPARAAREPTIRSRSTRWRPARRRTLADGAPPRRAVEDDVTSNWSRPATTASRASLTSRASSPRSSGSPQIHAWREQGPISAGPAQDPSSGTSTGYPAAFQAGNPSRK